MDAGRRTKGIAFGAALSLALYASGFLVIFTPLPILYVAVVGGRRDGWMAAASALALASVAYWMALSAAGGSAAPSSAVAHMPAMSLAAFFDPAFLLIAGAGGFAFFAAIGLALGEGAMRRYSLTRWAGTAFAVALSVMGLILAAGSLMGTEGGGFAGYLSRVMGEVIALKSQAEAGADAGFLADNAEGIISFATAIAPSILFVFALVAVVVNMLVGRRIIRGRHAFAHVHNVARFRLPDWTVWAAVAGGALFFADSYVLHTGSLKVAAINGLISLAALYFFQGLAVVAYFLQGVRAPFVKTVAYAAIVFFFQTEGVVIVAIGVADVWADFRLRSYRARHSHEA